MFHGYSIFWNLDSKNLRFIKALSLVCGFLVLQIHSVYVYDVLSVFLLHVLQLLHVSNVLCSFTIATTGGILLTITIIIIIIIIIIIAAATFILHTIRSVGVTRDHCSNMKRFLSLCFYAFVVSFKVLIISLIAFKCSFVAITCLSLIKHGFGLALQVWQDDLNPQFSQHNVQDVLTFLIIFHLPLKVSAIFLLNVDLIPLW